MSTGNKILDGLRDAVAGNFSRVTIDGQTWVRQEKPPEHAVLQRLSAILARDAKDARSEHEQATLIYLAGAIKQAVRIDG